MDRPEAEYRGNESSHAKGLTADWGNESLNAVSRGFNKAVEIIEDHPYLASAAAIGITATGFAGGYFAKIGTLADDGKWLSHILPEAEIVPAAMLRDASRLTADSERVRIAMGSNALPSSQAFHLFEPNGDALFHAAPRSIDWNSVRPPLKLDGKPLD